jgi:CRP/FNR family transcriptional regulator, cyclic AMP receptor protein
MFRGIHGAGVPSARLALLRQVPMFADLPDDLLARVDALVTDATVPAGTALTVENEPGRQAFIIAEGEAEVIRAGAVVAELGPGALVGEMSLLDNQPRSATVVAKTYLHVLVMEPRQFGALFADPHTAQWIAASLSRRLRDTSTSDTAQRELAPGRLEVG